MMTPERAPSDATTRASSGDVHSGRCRGPCNDRNEAVRRACRRLSILALSVGLVACGNKGDLYLPGSIEEEARVRLLESDGTIDESADAIDPTTGPAVAPLTMPDGSLPDGEIDPDEPPRRRTPAGGDGS